MKEIYEFLKECNTYYLATVENNQPRVRPFGTINIYEDKLYIQTSKQKNVSKQIQNNNKVEICGFKNGEWIRLSGELVRDDRIEAKKDMLDHYPNLRGMLGGQYYGIIYSKNNEEKLIKNKEIHGNNIFIRQKIKDNWYFYYDDYDGKVNINKIKKYYR